MTEKYIGCKSWMCHRCKHYIKFLDVMDMQDICWNNRNTFEEQETYA